MAVDIILALDNAYALELELNELVSVLRTANEGLVEIKGLGKVQFTDEQKQELVDKYVAHKANLQTLYKKLP